MIRGVIILTALLIVQTWYAAYASQKPDLLQRNKPIALDARIKTYIYSENEIFRLTVHYGYQTSIEFADGEEIQTISAGNNYAWQIVPVGRRWFIKPLEENVATNMTILTNKRAYHFDVESRSISNADEELVYVVRFFFPQEEYDIQNNLNLPLSIQESKGQVPNTSPKPFNFQYTYKGDQALAPLKIFDDGMNTFFKFKDDKLPLFSVKKNGALLDLPPRKRADYIVINNVSDELILTFENGSEIIVFNEQSSSSKR